MKDYLLYENRNIENLPKQIVKGYTLRGEIGKGATGIVFLAINDKTGEKVAIKFLYPFYARNKNYVTRLARESDSTMKIDHRNVIKSLGRGCSLGYYYIILEYVKGQSLSTLITQKNTYDEKEAAKIILEVAKGLECAHTQRIIHRDIKPDNIMIDEEGVVKIADFGLAKDEIDSSLTAAGTIIGTPCYISPEQAHGDMHLDNRTDLYSLGITFYHMVIGEPPFSSLNTSLLLTKKIVEEIPDPKQINPQLSQEVCYIIRKLSKRKRDERYLTPAELITDLEKYIKGEFKFLDEELDEIGKNDTVVEVKKEEINNPVLQNILVDQKVPCGTRILKTGEVLFYEDDDGKDTFVLLKGQLEVLKSGRQIALISTQGTFIGEMSYLLSTPRSATIRATVPTVLIEIKEKDFEHFLKECPEMSFYMAVGLANRLYKTDEQLKETQAALHAIRDQYKFIKQELELQ